VGDSIHYESMGNSAMETVLSSLKAYGSGLVVFAGTLAFVIFMLRVFTKSSIEEAIKTEFSMGIEKYKSELQGELARLNASLGKSQTIFTRQLEALTALRRIFRGILPRKSHPAMEWHDACEDIALSFVKHANDLDEFLCSHSAALPTDVLRNVETAISIATDGQFEFRWENPPEPTREAIDAANKFWETVCTAVTSLQTTVDTQIGARGPPT
jgi:hypothetical protein